MCGRQTSGFPVQMNEFYYLSVMSLLSMLIMKMVKETASSWLKTDCVFQVSCE